MTGAEIINCTANPPGGPPLELDHYFRFQRWSTLIGFALSCSRFSGFHRICYLFVMFVVQIAIFVLS